MVRWDVGHSDLLLVAHNQAAGADPVPAAALHERFEERGEPGKADSMPVSNRAAGDSLRRMDEDDDIDPSDDPIYRAGVLMGRNQALTDVMERLFSPDAASAEKTVRALHAWVQQTMDEVRVEMQVVFADFEAEDDEEDGQD